MRRFPLLLALGGFLCFAAAAPSRVYPVNVDEIDRAKNAGKPVPDPIYSDTPSTTSITSNPSTTDNRATIPSDTIGYGDNLVSKEGTCVLFEPSDWEHSQATFSMCKNVCGDAISKQVAAGKTGSVSCVGRHGTTDADKPVKQGGITHIPGDCVCNELYLDIVVDTFVEALPKIAEIAREAFINAFEMAFEFGALAIPRVGEGVGFEIVGSIAAARLADWTYGAANAGKSFANWAKEAGPLPRDMDKVFGIFNKPKNERLLPLGKFEPPIGIAKGSGNTGDKRRSRSRSSQAAEVGQFQKERPQEGQFM